MASERILIVDDDPFIRGLLSDLLGAEGYLVEAAGNVDDAIRLLSDHGAAVVLTDLNMPGRNGIEVLAYLRAHAPDTVALVITGYATLETAREAIVLGAVDYIFKPFKNTEVVRAVRDALERTRAQREDARLKDALALSQASEAISASSDPEQLHQVIVESALAQTGTTAGSLVLVDQNADAFDVVRYDAARRACTRKRLPMVPYPAFEFVLQRRQPLLLTTDGDSGMGDLIEHWRLQPGLIPEGLPETGELLLSPLRLPARTVGLLCVSRDHSEAPFARSDLLVLSVIANQAATMIENASLLVDLEASYVSTLESLALILEAKHPYTEGHTKRVTTYALAIGRRVGLTERELKWLRDGAMLHDIGKIGVSGHILDKRGPLTEDERQQMREHVIVGDTVVKPIRFLEPTRPIIRNHHERFDGSGWPDALKGEQIPLLVRIVTLADALDAMTSHRAYREPLPYNELLAEVRSNAGSQFDPALVPIALRLIEEGVIGAVNREVSVAVGEV